MYWLLFGCLTKRVTYEERVYFCSWLWGRVYNGVEGIAAETWTGGWEITSQLYPGSRGNFKRSHAKNSKPTLRLLPLPLEGSKTDPTPQPPKLVPPTRDQELNSVSPWRTFSSKPPQVTTYWGSRMKHWEGHLKILKSSFPGWWDSSAGRVTCRQG